MPTRRHVLAAGLASLATPVRAGATLGDDGLYHLDWYLESFLDLAEDIDSASSKSKRLAVMWGLKGCPACRRMHQVHLADPAIEGYIRANFDILHLNIIGARLATDLDGASLGEKALAARYGIEGTPSIQFFPETSQGLGSRAPAAREVARLPGLPEPPEFLAMFRYVREKGYERGSFAEWSKKA